jgi:hypothetical protein
MAYQRDSNEIFPCSFCAILYSNAVMARYVDNVCVILCISSNPRGLRPPLDGSPVVLSLPLYN